MKNIQVNKTQLNQRIQDVSILFDDFDLYEASVEIENFVKQGFRVLTALHDEDSENEVYLRKVFN